MSKEAMQMALNALIDLTGWQSLSPFESMLEAKDAIEALEAALAQPDPAECDGGQCGIGGYCKRCPKTQSEKEPVAWTVRGLITDFSRDFSAYQTKTYTVPLYTAPPQREYIGLTDKEVDSLGYFDSRASFVRAIEAKLKDKNT